MEFSGYDRMYVIIHGNVKVSDEDMPYNVIGSIEEVENDIDFSKLLLMGSSSEVECYVRKFKHRPYFIPVSQPVYDYLSTGPMVGIHGFYHLKELIWQQYIQMQCVQLKI